MALRGAPANGWVNMVTQSEPMTAAAQFALEYSGDGLDPAVLRTAYGRFPSGVVSVCAAIESEAGRVPVGMTASSFVPVSIDPPLVAFCVQWTSTTWPRLEHLPHLGISVLAEQHSTAAQRLSSKTEERFAGVTFEVSADGALFVGGAAAWLDCSVQSVVPAGDHGIVVLAVNALTVASNADPLVFHGSAFRRLLPNV
jgi:flavin reductase (DIM6/NTAB) family NADH-FMN oxidoreductase RutF